MKTFRHYLAESVRTYRYTIKIAGDLDKRFLDQFCYNLTKFDPVKIEDPKVTPVQKDPYGFPELANETVTIIKAEFKYPATEPMIQQMGQLLGCNVNQIRVITTDYNDSINSEADKYANQAKSEEYHPLLQQEEMDDNGKEASRDYGNQYLDKVVPKKPSIDYQFDATPTKTQPNKSKDGINTQSPMSKMKRPELPKTGRSK